MQIDRYTTIIMDAIDALAGWGLSTSSELKEIARNVWEMLGDCKAPGNTHHKTFKAYESVSITLALLDAGVKGCLPIYDSVELANTYLEKALSIITDK